MEQKKHSWKAKWIWTGKKKTLNSYSLFFKEFNIDDRRQPYTLKIVGQQRYEVLINGTRIGRGPGSQTSDYANYDTYNITKLLTKGKNSIFVRVYFCEEKPLPYAYRIYSDQPGLLAEISSKNKIVCMTDSSWFSKQDTAYDSKSNRINSWLAYQERFDASKATTCTTSINKQKWSKAKELAKLPILWENLHRRNIPSLRTTKAYPANVYSQTQASCYEHDLEKQDVFAQYNLQADCNGSCLVRSINKGHSSRIILDFGKTRTGYIQIIIPRGKGILNLYLGESLDSSFTDSIKLNGKPLNYSGFGRRSFRFLTIEATKIEEEIEINQVYLEQVEYPFEKKGKFKADNEVLNKVWNSCGETVQACSFDFYEDCPWREQALWMGDAQIDGCVSSYQFGDMKLLGESLKRLAAIQNESGWIPSVGPGKDDVQTPENFLPDHSIFWIFGLYDYYLYSGDLSLIKELYPASIRFGDYLANELDKNHLLPNCNRKEWWCFVDWSENLDRRDYVTAIQMYVYNAFQNLVELADAVGNNADLRKFKGLSKNIKSSINKYLWNDSKNAYVDCAIGKKYKQSKNISRQTNVLAIAWDIANTKNKNKIYKSVLCNQDIPPITTGYFNQYTIRAYFELQQPDKAIEVINEYWGEMLSRGATAIWETFDRNTAKHEMPERFWSLCHGFGCAPGYLLQSELLGIKPLKAGWEEVAITPKLGSLKSVSGIVPTPKGDISVDIAIDKSYSLDLKIPSGCSANITLPCCKNSEVTMKGKAGKAVSNDVQEVKRTGKYIHLKVSTDQNIVIIIR